MTSLDILTSPFDLGDGLSVSVLQYVVTHNGKKVRGVICPEDDVFVAWVGLERVGVFGTLQEAAMALATEG